MQRKPFPVHSLPRKPFPYPVATSIRRPFPAVRRVLSDDEWPALVYGYHPTTKLPIVIRKANHSYYEVSPELDPVKRNETNGVSQEIADAVFAIVFSGNNPFTANHIATNGDK